MTTVISPPPPTYGSPFKMIDPSIGRRRKTCNGRIPKEVVTAWSPVRGNILSTSFIEIGVGCAKTKRSIFWTQMFLGPR